MSDYVRAFVHHPDGTASGHATEAEAYRHSAIGDRIELCRARGLPQWVRVMRSTLPPAFGEMDFRLEPPASPAFPCR